MVAANKQSRDVIVDHNMIFYHRPNTNRDTVAFFFLSFFLTSVSLFYLSCTCRGLSGLSIISLVYRQVKVRPIDGQLVSGRAANPVMTVCRPWAAFDSAFCDADMMIQRGSRVFYLQYLSAIC